MELEKIPMDMGNVFYRAEIVDEILAEKNEKIARLEADNDRLEVLRKTHVEAIISMSDQIIPKQAKEIRKLKRSLWLARAYRAEARKNYWYARSCHEGDNDVWSIDGSAVKYIGCIKRTNFDWLKVWSEVEHKCRAKAEEYR